MCLDYKNRQEYNYRIVEIILKEIEKNPDLRFNQILYNLKIVDNTDTYYKESKEVYKELTK